MGFGQRWARGLMFIAAVAAAGAVLGADGRAPVDERALGDDKCVAQCDQESDKCMISAGKDASKQKSCDATYDACLRSCG
jgi:hypothetical protein